MRDSLRIILLFFTLTFLGCNLFSLRLPNSQEEEVTGLPHSFMELIMFFKGSIVGTNINQYELILSDSFGFRVCDRIYYSNPDFYDRWNKDVEKVDMQNLFLSLARGENYPVFFDKYEIVLLDTTSRDTQFARINYLIYFLLSSGEVDTAMGYIDLIGVKEFEMWQVDSIYDHQDGKSTCLSDVKIKFLSK